MQVEFLNSFSKDIDKVKDKAVKAALLAIIDEVKKVATITEIKNVKKLKGFKNYYRIRIGDYRLGIQYQNAMITFVRFLSRKDIYKYFP